MEVDGDDDVIIIRDSSPSPPPPLLSNFRRRCSKADGRKWWCKSLCLDGRSECEKHKKVKRKRLSQIYNHTTSKRNSKVKPKVNGVIEVDDPVNKSKQTKTKKKKRCRENCSDDSVEEEEETEKNRKADACSSSLSRVRNQKSKKSQDNANDQEERCLHCHQCRRNDKGRVVSCRKCDRRRFCVPCIKRWYPQMSEEAISESCPVCRGNCNCITCLRIDSSFKHLVNSEMMMKEEEKTKYSKYILHALLPVLKQISQEQIKEKEMEAQIQGLSPPDVDILREVCTGDERVYCDNCKTSIVDFHRSCPKCYYDLCLTCCWEIRDAFLQGDGEKVSDNFVRGGKFYLHGGKPCLWSSRLEQTSES